MDGDAADDEAHAREPCGVGTCPSTTSPINAVAGRSETRSAYVSCRMRAMASWSQTYGITDDGDADADPGQERGRREEGRRGAPAADRGRDEERDEHRRREPVDSTERRQPRDAVAEHDVEGEERVCECERDPSGSATSRTSVRRYTPATAAASASPFRAVRSPSAASAITGRNSIAATVPSGSRSIAR